MKKALLFYPCKGAMPCTQTRNMVDIARSRFEGWEIAIRILEGAPIQQARNEGVQYARDEKCTHLVQIDSDLDVRPPQLARLLSHESEIVCAIYSQRDLNTAFHLQPNNPPSQVEEHGLLHVKQAAIGCSKIALPVFDKIQADNPDRYGQLTSREGGSKGIWEFFAFELVGLNTPESRLASIASMVQCSGTTSNEEIRRILETHYLADNLHVSEDYNFCRLANKSGFKVKVDTQLIIPHEHGIPLPIATPQLMDMLKEPWRQTEVEMLNSQNN